MDDVYTNADVKKAIEGNNPFLWINIWFYVGLKFGFMSDILWFNVRLGQSPWSTAMCLVWQSVLFGNG